MKKIILILLLFAFSSCTETVDTAEILIEDKNINGVRCIIAHSSSSYEMEMECDFNK